MHKATKIALFIFLKSPFDLDGFHLSTSFA
jgi:hypothetical protein